MHPLLQYLIKHRSKILSGNKESYSAIEVINGKFIYYGGDTVLNEEEFRYEIPENEVLSKLMEYYDFKCEIFNLEYPVTESEWESFLREDWYI